jgi:flagellar hook-basal body complex protein FliE
MAQLSSIRRLAEAGMARTLVQAPRLDPEAAAAEKPGRRLEGPIVEKTPFGEELARILSDVNKLQLEAGAKAEALARGTVTDLHQVVLAQEEAGIAFRLVLEMRNKVIAAYQEIMRMPV